MVAVYSIPVPAAVLPLTGCSDSFDAFPTVTVSVAVPLVNPVAEAVIVALPNDVGVKLDLATPLVGVTGDAGLHVPLTPLAVNVTALVAVVTVLPYWSLMVALYATATPAFVLADAGVRTMLVAEPALPVAVNVTDPKPLALAATRLVPDTVPSVNRVDACPRLL